MTTFLMFPYANHLGGTQPLVAIGDCLRDAGHNVVFAARGKSVRYVKQCGFAVEDIAELDPRHAVAHLNKSDLDYHTQSSITEFVAQETALIRKHRPGAVVDLHRPTLGVSARLTRTPRAVLCNTVLTRYYTGEKLVPESHPLSALAQYLPRSLRRPLSAWAETKLFERWGRPYNAYLASHRAVPITSLKELFEGDATILMDAPELAPTIPLPPHVHAVGPLLHEITAPAQEWRAASKSVRHTIFVYLGSYGETFAQVVDYLGQMFCDSSEYRVVAATGGMYGYAGVPAMNVEIFDYVPASSVFSRHCVAMVTHGGRGSIYSALGHGVPLVGIPNQGEQEWNLDAIERLGLGRKVSAKHLSYETFRDALCRVLDDAGYRKRAEAFSDRLHGYDAPRTAARIIEDLACNATHG